jgi:hypothetical protein
MPDKPLVAGYANWRASGGKPGPKKGTGGRPRSATPRVSKQEHLRQQTLGTLNAITGTAERPPIPNLLHEALAGVQEYWRARDARKPRLAVDNAQAGRATQEPVVATDAVDVEQAPLPGQGSTKLTLVHDADALARDIANIGKLAIARIKETLSKPFDPADPNYAALLRFTSGVYNSTMTTMLRADENLLRARAVDRLPELLSRIAEEERKRHERQLEIDAGPGPDGAA